MVYYIGVNGNLFPVFVQLKLRPVLTDIDTDDALKAISEEKVLGHVRNLRDYFPTNKTHVSMAITYPGRVVASQIKRQGPLFIPSLNQVVVKINGDYFGKIFPQSQVDFLDQIKTPVKRPIVKDQKEEPEQQN
ncbi:hypothetical protein BG011_001340, partial [Mortierella polycephala]